MKQWAWLILCVSCISVGNAADTFTFVSALSSPIASFQEVETRYCKAATQPKGEFNAGSEASTGGTITVNAGAVPIQVETLQMEDNTKITSGNSVKWLVDTLQIGANGSVSVNNLIANTVSLQNGMTATLKVDNELVIDTTAYMTEGEARYLNVGRNGATPFKFESRNEDSGTASWDSPIKGEGDPTDNCYPIHS